MYRNNRKYSGRLIEKYFSSLFFVSDYYEYKDSLFDILRHSVGSTTPYVQQFKTF